MFTNPQQISEYLEWFFKTYSNDYFLKYDLRIITLDMFLSFIYVLIAMSVLGIIVNALNQSLFRNQQKKIFERRYYSIVFFSVSVLFMIFGFFILYLFLNRNKEIDLIDFSQIKYFYHEHPNLFESYVNHPLFKFLLFNESYTYDYFKLIYINDQYFINYLDHLKINDFLVKIIVGMILMKVNFLLSIACFIKDEWYYHSFKTYLKQNNQSMI